LAQLTLFLQLYAALKVDETKHGADVHLNIGVIYREGHVKINIVDKYPELAVSISFLIPHFEIWVKIHTFPNCNAKELLHAYC
jgi:hypothetical protein